MGDALRPEPPSQPDPLRAARVRWRNARGVRELVRDGASEAEVDAASKAWPWAPDPRGLVSPPLPHPPPRASERSNPGLGSHPGGSFHQSLELSNDGAENAP